MTESQLYEKLGRQQTRLEQQDEAYTLLLQRFAGVVSGELDRSRVLVNLTDRTWTVSEPGTRPATPPTINGLPLCVVAPVE